jgi:lipoprotein-releasing system permease protein
MPYELFIALRYLRAKRKQVMVSVITLIAILAVAAGVAALITVLALMTGFREEFQEKILSGTAHINLFRRDARPIENHQELAEKAQRMPGVRSATATHYKRVLIQGAKDVEGAILKGVDMSAPREANEIFRFTTEGDPASLAEQETDQESGIKTDRIIIGRQLAATVGLNTGDIATVISPDGSLSPVGMQPRFREFRVAGIFESGLAEYDSTWGYLSLDAARRLEGAEEVADIIQIKVDDVDRVKDIGREIVASLGQDYGVQDWQELNAPVYTALSYEKLFSGIALLIVIGIAALNIISVLVMIVMEKHRDIAILKSMGATSRSVMWLFMIQGLLIGIMGMAIGVIGGLVFCRLADSKQFIKLPAGAYALDYLPFHTRASDVLTVCAITVIISFLSTIYPSSRAARLDPVEALRYE